MKIAILSELLETFPPIKSGGVGRVVNWITEELVERGHEVTFFGPSDSKTSARLISVTPKPLFYEDGFGSKELEKYFEFEKAKSLIEIVRQQGDFDIIFDHVGWRLLLFSALIDKPIVSTIHGPTDLPYRQKVLEESAKRNPKLRYVSISRRQQENFSDLPYAANIYHGIKVDDITFSLQDKGYFCYVGRITSEKGIDQTIKAAIMAKADCKIAGKGFGDADDKYIKEVVTPLCENNQKIELVGEVDEKAKNDLLGNAKAMVNALCWEEPFGLTIVESMASGTPVVGYANGSMPELVVDGKTGFLVNSSPDNIRGDYIIKSTGVEGLSEAIEKVQNLSPYEYSAMRKNCREHVEKNFNYTRMVDEYEKLFESITGGKDA